MSDTAFCDHAGHARAAWPRSTSAATTASSTPLMELEIPQEPEFEMGGGGLYSTVPATT